MAKKKAKTATPFEAYFDNVFLKALDTVGDEKVFTDPNLKISEASWDRRAAYLLWVAKGKP